MKYCMDCGNYIPGGCDENCRVRTGGRKTSVCALNDATDCENYFDKEESPLDGYAKIEFRRKKKRRNGRKSNV